MGVLSDIHGSFDIECKDKEIDYDALIEESDQESWEVDEDTLKHTGIEKDYILIENLQKVIELFTEHSVKINGNVYVIYPEYPGEVEMIEVKDQKIKKYKAKWVEDDS